jgi:hypothetical protein
VGIDRVAKLDRGAPCTAAISIAHRAIAVIAAPSCIVVSTTVSTTVSTIVSTAVSTIVITTVSTTKVILLHKGPQWGIEASQVKPSHHHVRHNHIVSVQPV